MLDCFGLKDIAFQTVASRAAAHVPLPRITMSKSAKKGRIFILLSMERRSQDLPRERRGRGLYEGGPRVSNPKNQIFSGPVDR
jgi:hypothetical protein